MATINGITVKSYREFSGIEYPTIRECTVWKDGKKIGTYREDEWGGESHFSEGLEDIIHPSALQFQSGCDRKDYEDNADMFMTHLLTLAEYEKIYKANCKKGHPYTLFIGTNGYSPYAYVSSNMPMSGKMNTDSRLQNFIKKSFPNGFKFAWEFRSLSDFVLTVDKKHPVPQYIASGD